MNTGQQISLDLCQAVTDYAYKKLAVSIILLDESASMEEFGEAPLKAANKFLGRLKSREWADQTLITIITFNDSARVIVPPTLAPDLKPISEYLPRFCTRLYGTVSAILLALMQQVEELKGLGFEVSVTLSVITDGFDQPFTPDPEDVQDELKTRASLVRASGWKLNLIGVGVEASEIALAMGFPAAHAHSLKGFKSDMPRSFRIILRSMIMPEGACQADLEPASSH